MLAGAAASAQPDIRRHEVIIIDTSASVANSGGSGSLFNDYLLATRRLLETTPANTRVWVQGISNDGFGGLETLLRAWTPDAQGVFVDDLNRARRQMVAAVERKSVGLSPSARGTDVFGALAKARTSAEGPFGANIERRLVLLSDVVNDTPAFSMPTLVEPRPRPERRAATDPRINRLQRAF